MSISDVGTWGASDDMRGALNLHLACLQRSMPFSTPPATASYNSSSPMSPMAIDGVNESGHVIRLRQPAAFQ